MKPAALAQLVQAHEKPIKQFLRSKGASPALADDLAQDVWLRMLRLGREGDMDRPRSYLFRAAQNVYLSARDSACNCKSHDRLDDVPEELFLQSSAEDTVLDDDTCMAVRGALDRLPPRQKQFISMHIDGLTYREIATASGVTYRLVLRELVSAYAALRMDPVLAELRS